MQRSRSFATTLLGPAFVLVAAATLVMAALPALAQESPPVPEPTPVPEYAPFERPPIEAPVEGYTRSDGTIVLTDEGFCSYLLGSIWDEDELTFSALIDRSKKQKKARGAAFQPVTDVAVLQRCADTLNAFRLGLPEDDPLAAWARQNPVVPEALAALLPADLLRDPLAQPAPVGDGARTSGFGDLLSAPFGLTGGTYFVQVDSAACATWSGSLRGAGNPSLEFGPVEGQNYLYDVAPANYYWDISAPGCDWSVDLVAVDLGPEPTATPAPRAVVPKLFGDEWVDNIAVKNEDFLTAAQARAAILAAGLDVGSCTEEAHPPIRPGQVWNQDPPAGTLLEIGSTVDVWIGSDCDIVMGDRIEVG